MQYMNRQIPLTREEKKEAEAERERRDAELRLKNNRLGITVFQISWIMVFICLLIVYWQLSYIPGWQPTPEQTPDFILPTIATIGLVISAFLMRGALQTIEKTPAGEPPRFRTTWMIALILGVAFSVIMMAQFFMIPASDNGEQFGYLYRVMIGYHGIHAVAILWMMWHVQKVGADGRYHQGDSWFVEATVKLWYFVVVAWLMFFAVLYLPFLV